MARAMGALFIEAKRSRNVDPEVATISSTTRNLTRLDGLTTASYMLVASVVGGSLDVAGIARRRNAYSPFIRQQMISLRRGVLCVGFCSPDVNKIE